MEDSLELIKKLKENRLKSAFEKLKEDYIDVKILAMYSGLKTEIILLLISNYKEHFDIKEINKVVYIKAKDDQIIGTLIEEAKKYIEKNTQQ